METVRLILKLSFTALLYYLLEAQYSHGFVLLSSAASGGDGQGHTGFRLGESAKVYSFESKVLLNEVGAGVNDVGYSVQGKIHVGTIWESPAGEKLLKIQLKSPKLLIKSRKAPSPEGFVEHSSSLETIDNGPFYAFWRLGEIEKAFISEHEPISLVNLKRGITSLFQFQILDMETNETDVSGLCNIQYTSISPNSLRKTKTNCILPINSQSNIHPDRVLSAITDSKRYADYTLNSDNTVLKTVTTVEIHEMRLSMKQEVGNRVNVIQRLILDEDSTGETLTVTADTLKQAISELKKNGENLKEQVLSSVKEPNQCQDDCPSLAKLVKENRSTLKSSALGTAKSATMFIKMLYSARQAKADEILKALKGIKNKEILTQLCDLVGFTQTAASHQAAKKFFHFDSEYDVDNAERYLWALSIGTRPQEDVISDILKLSENENNPEKLSETLILTVSAMANKYAQQTGKSFRHKIVLKVKNSITHYLSKCSNSKCRITYIRGLKNLRHPDTVKILLDEALNGQKTVSVAAMKALKSMPKTYWNRDVIKACTKIFYELNKRYDSSSRTLAVDIILDSRPSEEAVKELVVYMTRYEKEFEVKQFLYQRLLMIADNCLRFRDMLLRIIKADPQINNWHVLGVRGLTTAFTRPFMTNQWANGSLVTIQEISGGVLKRGHVDVVLESDGEKKELFSLGLFAGGLSSFMGGSSVEDVDPDEEEVDATAGMELTVQGVQVRPFTFFSGKGELMGHVWSGTASDRTTAFQALSLLHDHSEWIALGNGVVAELSLLGASSFDLAGQIQLSIWSRVAHSLVEKSAGIVIQGLLKADTSFVRSQVEFVLASEPKLNLVSDIDFYSDVSLCMQVKQPDTTLKHNIYKIERIPGSKHKLRKSQYKTVQLPGKTYALNRKNNEMCNVIHNKA